MGKTKDKVIEATEQWLNELSEKEREEYEKIIEQERYGEEDKK